VGEFETIEAFPDNLRQFGISPLVRATIRAAARLQFR
jgi:hypothetical protein